MPAGRGENATSVSASGSRCLSGALLAVALVLVLPAWARGAESPARKLAVKYSRVLSLEPQAETCGSGEAYRPTSVAVVLGRPDVVLRNPDGKVVKHAPTSRDLWGETRVKVGLADPSGRVARALGPGE